MLNYTKLCNHTHTETGRETGILWDTDHEGEAVAALYVYSLRDGVWNCDYLPQVDEETETEMEEHDEESLTCAECSNELNKDEGIEHDGEHYCDTSCLADAGFVTLEDGDIVPEDDAIFTVDDEWQRLDDCVAVEVWKYSNGRHGRFTVWFLDGDSRISYCEDTQDYRLNEYTVTMHDGTTVSDEADVSRCEGCDEVFHTDDTHYNDGYYYCDSCVPSIRGADRIYRYSTDVISVHGFAPNPRKARTFGVELEVEGGDAEAVDDALDGCGILKEDGSLESGFEIVTRPAPMEETKRVILAAAAAAKTTGSESFNTNTCGFHVHIARAGLSDLRIGKLVAFFQSTDTAPELRKVAQRDSSRWAAIGGDLKVTEKPLDRYTALNLENDHTIEVRIFKGTLNAASLVAYLDFVETVLEWSAVCSLSDCYKWSAYAGWLASQNTKQSKSLLAWMKEKRVTM